jgi:hypothetical protein
MVFNKVTAYELDSLTGPAVAVAEESISLAGTSTSDALPPQCAVCVTLLTGRPGRSYRGRQYLGGFAVGAVDGNGVIETETIVAVRDFYAAWMGAVNDIGNFRKCVVLSPTLGIGSTITSVSVGNIWDTQRSRRDGVAETYSVAAVSQV